MIARIVLVSIALGGVAILALPAAVQPIDTASASLCLVDADDLAPGVTCTARQVERCVRTQACPL